MPTILSIAAYLLLAQAPAAEPNEVDQFMAKVFDQRDVNWADLDRYVFRETESFAVTSGARETLEKHVTEYVRFVRDGVLIRSTISVDGVPVGAAERRKSEDESQRDALRRREEQRRREHDADSDSADDASADDSAPPNHDGEEARRPRRRYFLGLEPDPGNYLFVGRETIDGREVVRIEYYPQHLFTDESDSDSGGRDEEDIEIERKLNKTTTVTLWILPDEHQIVRIELLNPGLDFLPLKWLARVGEMRMSMTMHQPIPDTWLAHEIVAHGEAKTALGSLEFDYRTLFSDYAQAGVAVETEFGGTAEVEPQ